MRVKILGMVDDRLFEVVEAQRDVVVGGSVGASRTFRFYDQAQTFLLPPSLDDWLPDEHTARFVSEVVDDMLDLSLIYGSYASGAGAPPFDPRMMLKLVVYAYSIGVTSSREIETPLCD